MNTIAVRTRIERDPEDGRDRIVPKILVDGQPLVDFDGRGLGADVGQLQQSVSEDGEFFIVTCGCGVAECAGIRQGITVRRDAKNVHWTVRGLGATRTLSFDRQAYAAAVEGGVKQLRRLCAQHDLDTVPINVRSLLAAR